jgi:hypothetical protein
MCCLSCKRLNPLSIGGTRKGRRRARGEMETAAARAVCAPRLKKPAENKPLNAKKTYFGGKNV